MDNHASHKNSTIRQWFNRRPRWHGAFTPTGSSWLNMVDRFFAEITERQIRRGVHASVRHPEDDVDEYIVRRNGARKPCTWIRTADGILEAIGRFCPRVCLDHSKSRL